MSSITTYQYAQTAIPTTDPVTDASGSGTPVTTQVPVVVQGQQLVPVQLSTVSGSPAAAATSPTLPSASGTPAAASTAAAAVATTNTFFGGAPSGVMAFGFIYDVLSKMQSLAQKTRTAQQQQSNNAALAGAVAQIKQTDAEQKSALVSLAGSAVGAALPLGAMAHDTTGIAMQSATQFGALATAAVDAASKNFGPQATVYQQQIAQKQDDLQKTQDSQNADNADTTAKAMTSGIQSALDNLDAYFRRQSDTSNNIAR